MVIWNLCIFDHISTLHILNADLCFFFVFVFCFSVTNGSYSYMDEEEEGELFNSTNQHSYLQERCVLVYVFVLQRCHTECFVYEWYAHMNYKPEQMINVDAVVLYSSNSNETNNGLYNQCLPGKTLTPLALLSPSLLPRTRTSGSSSMLKPRRAWTWVRLRTSSTLVGTFYFGVSALHGGCMHLILTEIKIWLLMHGCCTNSMLLKATHRLTPLQTRTAYCTTHTYYMTTTSPVTGEHSNLTVRIPSCGSQICITGF